MPTSWYRRAIADLDAIEQYISIDNPVAAVRTAQQVIHAVAMLDLQPRIGRPGRVPGTRELVVPGTPYIVAYTVAESEIVVLAVMHGARKWPDEFT